MKRLQNADVPRRFALLRDQDVSGVSGTGVVAYGMQFPDGHVSTRWLGTIAQTCAWDSIEDVRAIHGHGGATRIVWLDEPNPQLHGQLHLWDQDDTEVVINPA